jgi:hypothetical protein
MESLSALFPADLVKSASHFGLSVSAGGMLDNASVHGLLQHVAATVVQSVWRKYVARTLVEHIRLERQAQVDKMHADNLFQYHVLTSQSAVRRYLASRRASIMRSGRTANQTSNNSRYDASEGVSKRCTSRRSCESTFQVPVGIISASDLPPGSKFDADGNRIGGEHMDGDLAREMAAVVIQKQVKKRVQERFAKARRDLNRKRLSEVGVEVDEDGRPIAGFSRKYSAAEGVLTMARLFSEKSKSGPAPPSVQLIHRTFSRAGLNSGVGVRLRAPPSKGSALAAVFWDAGGLLLNPRTMFQLWGIRVLHDVTMRRRRDEPEFLPQLPLTIWVQGPLESDEEKRRSQLHKRRTEDQLVMSSPSGRAIPISRSITPRSGRRGLTGSALRRLSPLGLTKSPRQRPASPRHLPLSPRHHLATL